MTTNNQNIKLINKYFSSKMKVLKDNIQLLDTTIADWNTELTKWYKKRLSNPRHSDMDNLCKTVIREYSETLRTLKNQRKYCIQEYTELKNTQKVLHRAIEERWMNGFADGVRFVMDSYDTREEDK